MMVVSSSLQRSVCSLRHFVGEGHRPWHYCGRHPFVCICCVAARRPGIFDHGAVELDPPVVGIFCVAVRRLGDMFHDVGVAHVREVVQHLARRSIQTSCHIVARLFKSVMFYIHTCTPLRARVTAKELMYISAPLVFQARALGLTRLFSMLVDNHTVYLILALRGRYEAVAARRKKTSVCTCMCMCLRLFCNIQKLQSHLEYMVLRFQR